MKFLKINNFTHVNALRTEYDYKTLDIEKISNITYSDNTCVLEYDNPSYETDTDIVELTEAQYLYYKDLYTQERLANSEKYIDSLLMPSLNEIEQAQFDIKAIELLLSIGVV